MHSMYSRTTTYAENIHHTWWVKQCFPVCMCKAERHEYVMQITNTKKRGQSFLKWWDLSSTFLFQGLLCFKQTEQIPGFSISFLIMGHVLWVLQSCTGATHYKIKGTLPILFWKTPTHAKMRCVPPSPLSTRHPQRTASSGDPWYYWMPNVYSGFGQELSAPWLDFLEDSPFPHRWQSTEEVSDHF